MPNIFLSYAREDLARAGTVASALEKAGLSVWWDERMSGGSEYSKEIERALREADAVVVLWSAASVDSPWVRDEAAKGRDSGKLIPASLDGTEPPIGFGQFHTIDLAGRRRSAGLKQLVSAAIAKVGSGRSGVPHALPAAPVAGRRTWSPLSRPMAATATATAAAALVLILAAAYLFTSNPFGSRTTSDLTGGKVAIGEFEALSDDPETKPLARLTADAIERIFATNFIETVSAHSALAGAADDADFGVRGMVDKAGDNAIVSATIRDLKSGRTLWSTRLERPVQQSRELADAMAIRLTNVLRCSIYMERRMAEHRSTEVLARILRFCEAERGGVDQYEQMPRLARALIEVAPDSALAHAALANALSLRPVYPLQDVYAAARKALDLDPDNGPVRFALAVVADPAVSLAQRERLYRRGFELDPEFIWFKAHLGHIMWKVGRLDDARNFYSQSVNDYPLQIFQLGLSEVLAENGELQLARLHLERAERLRPGLIARPALRIEALFGEPAEARRWLGRANTTDEEKRCAARVIDALAERRASGTKVDVGECRHKSIFPHFELPRLDIALGDIDRAYAGIDELIRQEFWLPRFGPNYVFDRGAAEFRADSRFMPLMAKLGVAQYWLETNRWPDFCKEDRLPYDCREAARAAVLRTQS